MGLTVAVQNHSTVVPDAEVTKALPAFQHQVNYDFAPFWNARATLHFFEKDAKPPANMWRAEIRDHADDQMLGVHNVAPGQGVPDLVIGAADDKQLNIAWTVTFSHELLEALADPFINTCAQVDDTTFYALEVCDAVEDDKLAYEGIGGVKVSDFVTPAWFQPKGPVRPYRLYDFKGHLKSPLEIAEGGYANIFSPARGWYQQKRKDGAPVNVLSDDQPATGPGGSVRARLRRCAASSRRMAEAASTQRRTDSNTPSASRVASSSVSSRPAATASSKATPWIWASAAMYRLVV